MGQTVVDMSTAPPRPMRALAPAFQAKGVDFADAPVARTRRAAVGGMLSIMVGAGEAVFARLKPILATMGTEITLCGGTGAAATANGGSESPQCMAMSGLQREPISARVRNRA